ncbi:hypothetical protein SMALA_7360 [Streptomyces malaysiensis subsp. malaysiensis]|nr:hypothetical protein SMALA_7360 [Streptomyces malaysiensis]
MRSRAARREKPAGPAGAFAHASPSSPPHRKAVLFPAPPAVSRSPLLPLSPSLLHSPRIPRLPGSGPELLVPARYRADTAIRPSPAAKRSILTGRRRNSAGEDPVPGAGPAPGALLSRPPLVHLSTTRAAAAIHAAGRPRSVTDHPDTNPAE